MFREIKKEIPNSQRKKILDQKTIEDLFWFPKIFFEKSEGMSYVKNLETDEIRNDFLVTSDRKKLWNAQIDLIVEFQRVCEKYNLRFFAGWGTLLGAARHGGFIPWDDDVDLIMPREDYKKMVDTARKEFRHPYFFDLWYENDDPKEDKMLWYPLLAFSKLRNLETVQVESEDQTTLRHGIWIDIFPIDVYGPFAENESEHEKNLRVLQELFTAICMRPVMMQFLQNPDYRSTIDPNQLKAVMNMPLLERGKIFEDLVNQYDYNSKYASASMYTFLDRERFSMKKKHPILERKWFDETTWLPFENIAVPAPKQYDEALTAMYGNWREMVKTHSHGKNYSSDISYKRYFELLDNPENDSGHLLQRDFDEMRNEFLVTFNQKKFWRVQLDLIEQLKRFELKFFAIDQTLNAAVKYRGFDPENDFVRIGMTRSEFEKLTKLDVHFPYRFESGKFFDERTCMIDESNSGGIFIEIVPVDYELEIVYLPFEFTSIPVPKNYLELLKNFVPRVEKFSGDISADICYKNFSRR